MEQLRSDLEQERSSHSEDVSRLQPEVESLQEELALAQKDLGDSQSHVVECKNTVNILNDELERYRRVHGDLSIQVSQWFTVRFQHATRFRARVFLLMVRWVVGSILHGGPKNKHIYNARVRRTMFV